MYRSFRELCDAFAAFIDQLPHAGCLIIPDNDAAAIELAPHTRCQVITAGFGAAAAERISAVRTSPEHSRFLLSGQDFEIALCGQMNIRNAAMAALAARHFGIAMADSAQALRLFRGVRGRQEEVPCGDCTLVHDKASHPAALTELAGALRQRFPARRLVSIIQPRATGGRGWVYQRDLPQALAHFDRVFLTSANEHNPRPNRNWLRSPFCVDSLADALEERGVSVVLAVTADSLRNAILENILPDDVVLLTALEQSHALTRLASSAIEECALNRRPRCSRFA